jgi:hypothetical protein
MVIKTSKARRILRMDKTLPLINTDETDFPDFFIGEHQYNQCHPW